jgi:hypothetical protein
MGFYTTQQSFKEGMHRLTVQFSLFVCPKVTSMYRILVLFARCKRYAYEYYRITFEGTQILSFISTNRGVYHNIWETFPYVNLPTVMQFVYVQFITISI